MSADKMLLIVLITAVVTYLPRFVPIVFLRKKIENKYMKRLLTYLPYGMLSAMVVPAFLFSTASIYSAIAGFVTAVLLSLKGRGLFPVAVSATLVVFIVDQTLLLAGVI